MWKTSKAYAQISTHSLLAEGDSKTRQSFSSSIGEILQTHFFFFVPRTLFSSFSIKKVAFSGANLPGVSCSLPVRTRASHHQHIVRLISRVRADMLHLGAIIIPKDVKAQAVSIRINQSSQFCFQQAQLRCVQRTLEHRVLHALPMSDALLRNAAQAALSVRVDGIHVIGDEHKQSRPPHFHRNGG